MVFWRAALVLLLVPAACADDGEVVADGESSTGEAADSTTRDAAEGPDGGDTTADPATSSGDTGGVSSEGSRGDDSSGGGSASESSGDGSRGDSTGDGSGGESSGDASSGESSGDGSSGDATGEGTTGDDTGTGSGTASGSEESTGSPTMCGDGVAEGREDCDGDDLADQDCLSLAFDGGVLACTGGCSLDVSGCFSFAGDCCGDTGTPGCDDDACTTAVCAADAGCCDVGWDQACADAAFSLCPAVCDNCGDDVINSPVEVCDGVDLSDEDCVSLGYDGGLLDCADDCSALDERGCFDCVYAPLNTFTTLRAVEGWSFSGGWGLYREAPQSQLEAATDFGGQVLGTDGNRVAPYPGAEAEASTAVTGAVTLPSTISFASWHVDQGGGAADNKTIRVSVDGGMSWDVLADCAVDPSPAFCAPVLSAADAAWTTVDIAVPLALQGSEGIVEFGYDSVDACCEFEKGWYLDDLNLVTECGCFGDEDCAAYGTECADAVCDPSGECGLDPMPEGASCGRAAASDCDGADACDAQGYCRDNVAATGLSTCNDCPGGAPCGFCDAGQCPDCAAPLPGDYNFNDPASIDGWTVEAIAGTPDWRIYTEAPPSDDPGSLPIPFPNAPVYGTDGNRDPPYPGTEQEHSSVTTVPFVVPGFISFISWHVDEGSIYDTKRIELSIDDGESWIVLEDCDAGPGVQPFCDSVNDRLASDWDPIFLNTATWQGEVGRLRFTYNTLDSCCGFERGWFIDDLDLGATCSDEPFPP